MLRPGGHSDAVVNAPAVKYIPPEQVNLWGNQWLDDVQRLSLHDVKEIRKYWPTNITK